MDERFDDILRVNRNNTESEIYKKYEEMKEQSDQEDDASIKDELFVKNNSSFYSALKSPAELAAERATNPDTNETSKEEVPDDPTELTGEPKVIFDLFNLNRESQESDESNIIKEKKLVNDGKQNIINENNKAETVDANQGPVFEFQTADEDVNYQDTFKGLRQHKEKKLSKSKFDTYTNNSPVSTVDLKNKIFAAGYKLRTYQKLDSDNYYYMKYYLSNKLNFDCSMITAVIMMFLVGIMWLAFDNYVKLPIYAYIGMMAGFLLLPIVTGIVYAIGPKVRKPANFSFKLTILNAIMVYLVGLVVCLLVAFFAVGADIGDISTLVCPLIYPLFCMLVIPVYVINYQLLYITKRYYIE